MGRCEGYPMTDAKTIATLKRDLTELRKREALVPRTLRPAFTQAIRKHEARIAALELSR